MAERGRMKRTSEERTAALDQKIQFHQEKIQLLEQQKKEILNPSKKRKSKAETLNEIYKTAKASGKTLDDVLQMLKSNS